MNGYDTAPQQVTFVPKSVRGRIMVDFCHEESLGLEQGSEVIKPSTAIAKVRPKRNLFAVGRE